MVNWISVRSLLAIASIHGLPIKSIDFVLYFNQADLDVDVLMCITLGMEVLGNRREGVIKLNKSLYGFKQASENCFDVLTYGRQGRGYHQ